MYDGLVSRYINRRFSRPIARALQHTPATPNQVTVLSLAIAGIAFALFLLGYPVGAGLATQLSSIIDGVDGDLARLKGNASPFGSFFDAVADRYADGLVVLGLTVWAANQTVGALPWIAGFAALGGSFAVTYTRAMVHAVHRTMFDNGLASLATRDIRMLLVTVGAVTGLGIQTLLALALLTNIVVAVRVITAWRMLRS